MPGVTESTDLDAKTSALENLELHSIPRNSWIAIEPPRSPRIAEAQPADPPLPSDHVGPPSFAAAQFDIVLRRQHTRPKDGGGVKHTAVPSRFLKLSNSFEFAGWGTLTRLELTSADCSKGEDSIQNTRRAKTLGQFTASALAGNAVLGSVFYALPAVVAASGVYSPISLLVATTILFLWRPIMEELASALPLSGAPYTYLLNVSSKWFALLGAAMLLLDFASTSVVSAATAATYLAGEVSLPFPSYLGTVIILVIFTTISLSGLRESARIALAVLSLHILTMIVLFVASIIAWSRVGNSQLHANWATGRGSVTPDHILHQVFNGFCIGMLGLTGFECTPSYVSSIKPGRFPLVLRNLHYPAILLNCLAMLFLLALVPYDSILSGANVLSALAEVAAGKWLRIWVVVDAVVVLCGGVLTGILGASELSNRLSHDRLLPQLFLRRLPVTGAPFASMISFAVFCGVLYATAGASLSIVSKMFSCIWLIVMTLFPVAVLLLKFNRGRLPRQPHTPLSVVFLALLIAFVAIGGNISIDPTIIGYAAAYLVVLAAIFYITMKKVRLIRWFLWTYDQSTFFHTSPITNKWGDKVANIMRRMRRQPVCVLVKTDEINRLFHKLMYVSQNEETSCLKLVHFYDEEDGIPSEMEANWKILDEAFPEITIDLVLVHGQFNPSNVAALAHRLEIPTSLMFMSCPGPHFPYPFADFGTRIISL
ncbi:hypothetical protein K474DRAFT_1669815 [Panus rudis PR-1116 ss-1]|nr:hypothetical protein K474DRAFT_1669815 [Panus rudis PR-1116 ss-1]